jgi:hypothetical protein
MVLDSRPSWSWILLKPRAKPFTRLCPRSISDWPMEKLLPKLRRRLSPTRSGQQKQEQQPQRNRMGTKVEMKRKAKQRKRISFVDYLSSAIFSNALPRLESFSIQKRI